MSVNTSIGSATGGETTLMDKLAGIAWDEGFRIGSGLDATSGALKDRALEAFEPERVDTRRDKTEYGLLTSRHEAYDQVDVAVDAAKYGMWGTNLSVSASYCSHIRVSEIASTLVAKYENMYSDYELAPDQDYRLTSEAQKLVSDPPAFRKAFGDYFIAGAKHGSRYTGVYTFHAESYDKMQAFETNIKADTPRVFTAEGSVKLTKQAADCGVEISVFEDMQGFRGTRPATPLNPEGIYHNLTWFQNNQAKVPVYAYLYHYTTLDHRLPATIPVNPEAWNELRTLYNKMREVQFLLNSCPPRYNNRYAEEIHNLVTKIQSLQNVLAEEEEAGTRKEYLSAVERKHDLLSGVMDRAHFYEKVRKVAESKESEPEKDKKQNAEKGMHIWLYGRKQDDSSAVVIARDTQHHKIGYKVGKQEHTFNFDPNPSRLYVAWEVISNWTDGTNGSWRKTCDKILLKNEARVTVQSAYDRGMDWSCNVYYVDPTDYDF